MQQFTALILTVVYVVVSCFANIAYKFSVGGGMRTLITWQAVAALVGLLGVASLSWLYKLIPMHIAYPLTQALLIVAIQVVAARLVFKESITPTQWLGTALVILGIFLITVKKLG